MSVTTVHLSNFGFSQEILNSLSEDNFFYEISNTTTDKSKVPDYNGDGYGWQTTRMDIPIINYNNETGILTITPGKIVQQVYSETTYIPTTIYLIK